MLDLWCEDGYGFDGTNTALTPYPDLNGDGRREILVTDDNSYCDSMLIPLPTTSPFKPIGDPETVFDLPLFEVLPDQTGDKQVDVMESGPRVVHSWPVTFKDGSITSAATIVADNEILGLNSVPFDLDFDGIADFIGWDAVIDESEVIISIGASDDISGETLVLVSGGDKLVAPTYAKAWAIEGGSFNEEDAFVEEGVLSVLVNSGVNGVVVIDVGPAVLP